MTSFWPTFNRVESTPGLALAIAVEETPNLLPMWKKESPLITTYSRAGPVGCSIGLACCVGGWPTPPAAEEGPEGRSASAGLVAGVPVLVGYRAVGFNGGKALSLVCGWLALALACSSFLQPWLSRRNPRKSMCAATMK